MTGNLADKIQENSQLKLDNQELEHNIDELIKFLRAKANKGKITHLEIDEFLYNLEIEG